MRLNAFLRLARVEHSIFLAIAVVIGELVVTENIELLPTLFGMLSVFFIGIASFTINDFLDYNTDKKNKRKDRPLVNGSVSMWAAIVSAKVGFPLGVLLSLFVNMECFVIAVIFSALAIAYSYYLKKLVLIGNLFIAFSMAVPLVYGSYIVSGDIDMAIRLLASIAFLTGVGREIIKSVQDMKGDKASGRRTLPIAVGRTFSVYFAAYYVILAIVISPAPFLALPKFLGDWLYMGPVIAADVMLLWSVYLSLAMKELEKVRKISLSAMGIGLIGFLLGALF